MHYRAHTHTHIFYILNKAYSEQLVLLLLFLLLKFVTPSTHTHTHAPTTSFVQVAREREREAYKCTQVCMHSMHLASMGQEERERGKEREVSDRARQSSRSAYFLLIRFLLFVVCNKIKTNNNKNKLTQTVTQHSAQ